MNASVALPPMLSAMRPHHWAKNLLVFVPLLAAGRHADIAAWIDAGVVFAGFCLAASGVYLFNDWMDRAADRQHPVKRLRAVAAGRLSPPRALAGAAVLTALAMVPVAAARSPAWPLIVVYLLAATAYTAILKRLFLFDVVALVALYLLRLAGGAVATGIALSPWLVALAAGVFTTIALAKRLAEIVETRRDDGDSRVPGRPYGARDLPRVARLAAAAAALATGVLAAYPVSDNARAFYAAPWLLWLLALVLGYWLHRLLKLARRGALHLDPVVFAAGDRATLALAAASIVVLFMAR